MSLLYFCDNMSESRECSLLSIVDQLNVGNCRKCVTFWNSIRVKRKKKKKWEKKKMQSGRAREKESR